MTRRFFIPVFIGLAASLALLIDAILVPALAQQAQDSTQESGAPGFWRG